MRDHDLGAVGLDHEEGEEVREVKRRRVGAGPGPGPAPEKGLVKGEAGFLRRAEEAGVKVVKAPRGMSRARMNASKWHPKYFPEDCLVYFWC